MVGFRHRALARLVADADGVLRDHIEDRLVGLGHGVFEASSHSIEVNRIRPGRDVGHRLAPPSTVIV